MSICIIEIEILSPKIFTTVLAPKGIGHINQHPNPNRSRQEQLLIEMVETA
jgi:hypothetical protein